MSQPSPVDEVFLAALEKGSTEERAAYLDRACGSDTALRRRVERLLDAHPRVGRFMGEPEVVRGATIAHAPASPDTAETVTRAAGDTPVPVLAAEGPGSHVGPYKLLQKIGEGGMGLVYMAEQLEPVRRKVAVKIVKPGLDSSQVVARFEAERQALALMDHLHIAKVLDAGTTETGRPFFVMELVRGVPITEYCDQNQLPPRERLELFVPVCQAIQHAHQKGIIHRDIKPTNVLITLYDGRPVPKVIDFGVAKAIDQPLTERTMFTQFGTVVGTLDYMSPEQAGMSGLDVDTRSDIYSLGVLLFELLTGSTPLDRERRRRASFDELLRLIREEESPRPSTRITGSGAELAAISSRRRTEPQRLAKLMRGELDWIVMKCLEKDRGRRYETANALAADVLRYLADEPVEACPPSAVYRLRKFARKHKALLATAAALGALVASGVGLVLLTRANSEEQEQRARAEMATVQAQTNLISAQQAERRARAEAAKAAAINTFLLDDLLTEAAPDRNARFRKVTVEEVLHRAAAKVDKAFAGQPEVEAAVREAIGTTFGTLGLYHEAEAQLRAAVGLFRRELGPDNPDTLRAAGALGRILVLSGRYQEAETTLRAGLDACQRTLGTDHPVTLRVMGDLALLLDRQGKGIEAQKLCGEALEASRRVLGNEHPDTLALMKEFTTLLRLHARRDVLETKLYQKATLPKPAGDPPTPLAPPSFPTQPPMAVMKMEPRVRGTKEGEQSCREGLETASRVLGTEHPITLQYMNSLALELRDEGKLTDAEKLCRQTLETSKRVLGPDHPLTLQVQENLGMVLLRQGKPTEAEPLVQQGLEGQRARLGAAHPVTVRSMHNLALVLTDQGKLDQAEPLLREVVRLTPASGPAGQAEKAADLFLLGSLLVERGKAGDAVPFLRESLDLRVLVRPEPAQMARTKSVLGACLIAEQKYADAESLLLQGYDELKKAPGTAPQWVAEAGQRIVRLYEAWSKPEQAREWREKLAAEAGDKAKP